MTKHAVDETPLRVQANSNSMLVEFEHYMSLVHVRATRVPSMPYFGRTCFPASTQITSFRVFPFHASYYGHNNMSCSCALETVRRFNGVINFNITPLSLLFDCFTSSSTVSSTMGVCCCGNPPPRLLIMFVFVSATVAQCKM